MRCRELCSAPIPVLSPCPLEEARRFLILTGLEACVVAQGDKIYGLLERRTLEHALRFGLEVDTCELVQPDIPLVEGDVEATPKVLNSLLRNPTRRAIVCKERRPFGLLSAEDLLREGLSLSRPALFSVDLPSFLKKLAEVVYELSLELKLRAYLVGGAVRDLLLGRLFYDVDLIVTGNLEAFASRFASQIGAKRVKSSLFGTVKFRRGDWEIDVAQCRWEYYEAPGALPHTAPGPLEDDLFRRDFTLNAMALSLSPPHLGRLFDLFGGQTDLQRRCLRVHHPLSFVDDPTRLFRAARYMSRLGLNPSPGTMKARDLALKLGVLHRLSPARLRQEFVRILQEDHPEKALFCLQELKVLEALVPSASALLSALSYIVQQDLPEETRLEALALLLARKRKELAAFLVPSPKRFEHLCASWAALKREEGFLRSPRPLSEKVFFLEKFPLPVLLAQAAERKEGRVLLERCLKEYFSLSPHLSGERLKEKGVPPGPLLGEMLKKLRAARLDGLVKSEEDEWALLRKEYPHVFLT